MEIVIKKRVSLGFLGEDYKDSYLTLASVPFVEYEALQDKISAYAKKDESLKLVKEEVVKRFLDGKIAQDGKDIDITKDNILQLPGEVFSEVFEYITGKTDPKV